MARERLTKDAPEIVQVSGASFCQIPSVFCYSAERQAYAAAGPGIGPGSKFPSDLSDQSALSSIPQENGNLSIGASIS